MKDKIELFAQILNLKWQFSAEILNLGQKIVNQINEAKAFEMQYQHDKKRIEREYQEITKTKN